MLNFRDTDSSYAGSTDRKWIGVSMVVEAPFARITAADVGSLHLVYADVARHRQPIDRAKVKSINRNRRLVF